MAPRFDAYVRTKQGGYRFWNSATGDEIEVADTAAAANEAMRINSASLPSSTPADTTGAAGAPGAVAPLPAGAGGAPQAAPVVVQTAGPAPDAPADQGAQGAPAVTPPPAPAPVAPAAPPPLAPTAAQMGAAGAPAHRPVGAPPRPVSGPAGGPPPAPRDPPMVLKGRAVTKEGVLNPATVALSAKALEAEAAARGLAVEAKADRGEEEARIATRAGGIESAYGQQNVAARHQGLRLYDEVMQARARLQDDIAETKIDSGRLWKNAGAAGQAAAGLGIIAGSIGAAMTGSGARNLALETIERAIDRDVQEQVADLEKKRYQATELTKYGEDLRRFWGEDKTALGNEMKAALLSEQARRAEALAKTTTDKEKAAQYAAIAADLEGKKAALLASNDGKVKVAELYGPPAPVGGGAPKKKPQPYAIIGGQIIPLRPGMSEADVTKMSTVAMAAANAKRALHQAKAEFQKAALGTVSPDAAIQKARTLMMMAAVDGTTAQFQGQATEGNIKAWEDKVYKINGEESVDAFIESMDRAEAGLVQQFALRDQDQVDATTEAHLARQRGGR